METRMQLFWTHNAAVPAVLHVNMIVQIIPHALNAQEAAAVCGVAAAGERVNKKVLPDAAAPRQHQDPAVHP